MGCDKLLRCTAFHSIDFFCRMAWQKFIASWCTFLLFSKNCKICNFSNSIQISNNTSKNYNYTKHPSKHASPKPWKNPLLTNTSSRNQSIKISLVVYYILGEMLATCSLTHSFLLDEIYWKWQFCGSHIIFNGSLSWCCSFQ